MILSESIVEGAAIGGAMEAGLAMKGKVLLDFHADWCGPCQQIKPIFDRLSLKHQEIKFFKVDVDLDQATAMEFCVRSIPTVLFLNNGEEVDRIEGIIHEKQFSDRINCAFKKG